MKLNAIARISTTINELCVRLLAMFCALPDNIAFPIVYLEESFRPRTNFQPTKSQFIVQCLQLAKNSVTN